VDSLAWWTVKVREVEGLLGRYSATYLCLLPRGAGSAGRIWSATSPWSSRSVSKSSPSRLICLACSRDCQRSSAAAAIASARFLHLTRSWAQAASLVRCSSFLSSLTPPVSSARRSPSRRHSSWSSSFSRLGIEVGRRPSTLRRGSVYGGSFSLK